MFKYSAFTENTSEMREYLEKIGYNESSISDFDKGYYIKTQTNGIFYTHQFTKGLIHALWSDKIIDCTGNPELFKAIAAINDENDYMQWFICNQGNIKDVWFLCDQSSMDNISRKNGLTSFRKATIEELKEHFKI